MKRQLWIALLWTVGGLQLTVPAAEPTGFDHLGIPVRAGGLMGCLVGPNGRGGEALYFNFNQIGGNLFLVQVDPDTGESQQFNSPTGPGAWAFILGPDGRIYLGTWDGGLILRFDPQQPEKGIEVVGKPAASESYLWQFALAPDGWLYGCTYPNAKLVRFQPITGQMEDLGRMHPTEMYARSVAVGPTGKVYLGIGTEKGDLVVFDPETKQHRSILPPRQTAPGSKANASAPRPAGSSATATSVHVSRRADGQVYATCDDRVFRLDDTNAVEVPSAPGSPPLKLRDGREVVAYARGEFSLKDPRTGRITRRQFKYAGAGDAIFVVGVGPSNCIYGSTVMPLEVFRYDPIANRSEHLGAMPGGEVYSMLEYQGKLYLCYYGGAVMNLYDPAKPFWKFGTGADCNPVSFGGVGDGHLRPRAMIHGPNGMIYVGSEPPYGQLGGAMGVWDPRQNKTLENYRHIVTNQSVVSLAWEPKSGLIFGGSANVGGGGTRPTEKEAKFFAFDPKAKQKVFEAALVPGARSYPATLAADGKVFTTTGSRLLVFDPKTKEVTKTIPLPGGQTEISLGRHASGKLVGLAGGSVYILDPVKGEIILTEKAPVPIRCGFALTDDAVYFGSGAALWRYRLPKL